MVASSSRFVVNSSEVTGQVIDGEAIIMNLSTGMFYSTDKVGASIWSWVEQGLSVEEIIAEITVRYDVSEAQARSDLDELVGQLLGENLVHTEAVATEGRPPHLTVPAAATRAPYHAPELNRYSDMTDMLALDPPMPVLGAPWGTKEENKA